MGGGEQGFLGSGYVPAVDHLAYHHADAKSSISDPKLKFQTINDTLS